MPTEMEPVVKTEELVQKSERQLELEERRKFFHGEPLLNVVKKDEFQKRVAKVFKEISDILACSFGASGAPTIISKYPYSHVTKDGFTIFKNITCDIECGSIIDSVIANLIGDICGRLNYKVGDGTTTAIVATNAIYETYYENKEFFERNNILPRDIVKEFTKLKDYIVEQIKKEAVHFTDNKEEMLDTIEKIVRISSNGDEELTRMIREIYDKIGYPSITAELSKDGVTRYQIIDGFRTGVMLTDKIYENTDDGFFDSNNLDVIIFDHRVDTKAYEKIIKPLNIVCKAQGRELMVIAPTYSDNTIQNEIRKDILSEYKETRKSSLILCVCKAQTANAKRSLADLAMLLNTTIIDRNFAQDIIEDCINNSANPFYACTYFNFNRGIENLSYIKQSKDGVIQAVFDDSNSELEEYPMNEKCIDVGFTGKVSAGENYSIFSDFHYNEALYNKFLDDAKTTMDDLVEKYAKLGTFNYEVTEAMKRYSSLQLMTAVIEVGGDSELSQAMLKDSVEDAIRAAESAYNNGYILGCNVTTMKIINNIINNEVLSDVSEKLYRILYDGLIKVYSTVLSNAFGNPKFRYIVDESTKEDFLSYVEETMGIKSDVFNMKTLNETFDILNEGINSYFKANQDVERNTVHWDIDIIDVLIDQSIKNSVVFDLSTKEYNKDVINSAATDIEVLTAVVDLMNILITGNQLIVTGKHNF